MMLLARPALSIACVMPAFSERRFSEAMRPAGLSAPVLIFKPVLSRSRLVLRLSLFLRSTRWAINELTFVLILLMTCLSLTSSGAADANNRALRRARHIGAGTTAHDARFDPSRSHKLKRHRAR